MYELKHKIIVDVDNANRRGEATLVIGEYPTKHEADQAGYEFMLLITAGNDSMKGSLETGWMTIMPCAYENYIFVEPVAEKSHIDSYSKTKFRVVLKDTNQSMYFAGLFIGQRGQVQNIDWTRDVNGACRYNYDNANHLTAIGYVKDEIALRYPDAIMELVCIDITKTVTVVPDKVKS